MDLRLSSKKIILAISGGIAAYKSAELCRELKRSGAEVRVVMTASAVEFITPLTMQALSGEPVHTDLLDTNAEAGMGHIELAKWPDIIVVAPATANFLSRYSAGAASDLLSTLLLASNAPVAIVPAMNQAMWSNPLTQRNIHELSNLFGDKLVVLGPGSGEQACGDVGLGRMLEPLEICQKLGDFLGREQTLKNKRVVITAGPTREAIDPVRYISNHSSGKMGYALASSCQSLGAQVILVSGPTNLESPYGVNLKSVVSAQEMHNTVMEELVSGCDIFIACAAVADFRPDQVQNQKIKKKPTENKLTITMEKNPDIVASVSSKHEGVYVVGFAAETNNLIQYARNKLESKKLDMIVANDVSSSEAGFNSDYNEVHILTRDEEIKLDKNSKSAIADKIIERIVSNM